MRRKQLGGLLLAAALLLPTPASAQGEDTSPPSETSGPNAPDGDDAAVVTTSARAPMPAFSVDRSQNVIDESELRERTATSLSETLADEPGVTSQSTNRGAGTLILRGLVGPENLIVVDGVRFNQSTFRTGPNQYLDTIDPWGLRRIEIVRGPAGVLYGTGAMGGVVEAHPLALPNATEARGQFLFRSADHTAAASADAGTRTGDVSGRAGVTLRRHGQLRVGGNGSENELFLSGVDGEQHLAQGYDELHLRAATGVDIGRQRVRANYIGALIRDTMRVDRLGHGELRIYDNDDHLAYVTGELDGPPGVDELRINVSWHRTGEDVRRFTCAAPDGRVSDRFACAALDRDVIEAQRFNEDTVDTFGSSFTGVSRLLDLGLQLTWGGDAYFDQVQSRRADARAPDFEFEPRDRGNFADGSTYRSIGAFGLVRYDALRVDAGTLRAQAGARIEHFGAAADGVTDEIGDIAYDFTGLVGSAGISWLRGTTLHAYLNWNQGFRAPNLQETTVLGDSGNFYEVPNPDLGPERSDTFELGAKTDWAQIVELESAIWLSSLSNRITRAPTTFGGQDEIDGNEVRHRVNRDFAYYYGADLGARTHRWKHASLFGSISWTDGAVEADAPDPTFVEGPFHSLLAGDRDFQNPRRLPPISGTLGVRYAPIPGAYFSFYTVAAARQSKLAPDDRADLRICEVAVGVLAEDVGQTCEGTPGWLTFNARAGYRYENLLLDVAALNLTDQRYQRHGSGVLGAGFDLAVQVTLEY